MTQNCDRCHAMIKHGDNYFCVTYNREHFTGAPGNNETVTVDHSEVILVLCKQCGNTFSATAIAQLVKAIPVKMMESVMN